MRKHQRKHQKFDMKLNESQRKKVFNDTLDEAHISAIAQGDLAMMYFLDWGCGRIQKVERMHLATAWINIAKNNSKSDKSLKSKIELLEKNTTDEWRMFYQENVKSTEPEMLPELITKLSEESKGYLAEKTEQADETVTNLMPTDPAMFRELISKLSGELKDLAEKAKQGDAAARFTLATRLMESKGDDLENLQRAMPKYLDYAKQILLIALYDKKQPAKADVILALAKIYNKQGSKTAVHWYKAAAAAGNAEAFEFLARYYVKLKQFKDEYKKFEHKTELVKTQYGDPEKTLDLAREALFFGNFHKATEYLRLLLTNEPSNSEFSIDAKYLLTSVAKRAILDGDYRKAAESLCLILTYEPSGSEDSIEIKKHLLNSVAENAILDGDCQTAVKYLYLIIASEPSNSPFSIEAKSLLNGIEAEASKWTLLLAENNNPSAQFYIAKNSILNGEYNTAAQYLRLILANEQETKFSLEAKCLLGLLYADPESPVFDYDEAMKFYINLERHLSEEEQLPESQSEHHIRIFFQKLRDMVKTIEKQRHGFIAEKQKQAADEKKDMTNHINYSPHLKKYHDAFIYYFKHLLDNFENAKGGIVQQNPLDMEGKTAGVTKVLSRLAGYVPFVPPILDAIATILDLSENKQRQQSYHAVVKFFRDLVMHGAYIIEKDAYLEYLTTVITLMKDKEIEKEAKRGGGVLDYVSSAFDGKEICAITKMAEEDVNRCFAGIIQEIVQSDQHSIHDFTELALNGKQKSKFFKQKITACFDKLDIYLPLSEDVKPNYRELFKEQASISRALSLDSESKDEKEHKDSPRSRLESKDDVKFSPTALSLSLHLEPDEYDHRPLESKRADSKHITRQTMQTTRDAKQTTRKTKSVTIDPELESVHSKAREAWSKKILLEYKDVIETAKWELGRFGSRSKILNNRGQVVKVPEGVAVIYNSICAELVKNVDDQSWYAVLTHVEETALFATLYKTHTFFNRRKEGTTGFYNDVIKRIAYLREGYPEAPSQHTLVY